MNKNNNIFKLLSGFSIDDIKIKLNNLSSFEKYNVLKKLNLNYTDIYSQQEIESFTGFDKLCSSNIYDYIYDININNKAKFLLNDKYGIIDENGKELCSNIYDKICNFYENKAIVRINDKYGFINENGEKITQIKYNGAAYFIDNIAIVQINYKYGFINENGKEISQIKYDLLYRFGDDNKAKFQINDKIGYLLKDGKEIY